ncbi:hypothetical protein AURDEDRAFT_172104 [Auricularia subglabra TFB-10046 SS5]|nr:hypothetical protein AURDEDRAFT_172104 [Auricularia subglabra TFB-10046 SS5]
MAAGTGAVGASGNLQRGGIRRRTCSAPQPRPGQHFVAGRRVAAAQDPAQELSQTPVEHAGPRAHRRKGASFARTQGCRPY